MARVTTAPKTPLNPPRPGRRIDTMTREEIDAKLEAVEARTETRFVELSGKVDRLGEILTGDRGVLAQLAALRTETFDRFAAMSAEFSAMKADTAAQFAATETAAAARFEALETSTSSRFAAARADTSAQFDAMKTDTSAQFAAMKADNKTTRWTVVVTVITSMLAAAALVMSVQANLLAAFQAGQPQSSASSPP